MGAVLVDSVNRENMNCEFALRGVEEYKPRCDAGKVVMADADAETEAVRQLPPHLGRCWPNLAERRLNANWRIIEVAIAIVHLLSNGN